MYYSEPILQEVLSGFMHEQQIKERIHARNLFAPR